jgi:hypothetical protein
MIPPSTSVALGVHPGAAHPGAAASAMIGAAAAWIAAFVLIAATFFAAPLHAQDKGGGADAAITQQVERFLARDATLRSMEIHVETLDGVVNLRGFVRTLEDIARAGGIAGAVSGVSAVRNRLRVADRPSRS